MMFQFIDFRYLDNFKSYRLLILGYFFKNHNFFWGGGGYFQNHLFPGPYNSCIRIFYT